jgi:hypothetical protein
MKTATTTPTAAEQNLIAARDSLHLAMLRLARMAEQAKE